MSNKTPFDKLYAQPLEKVGEFVFDEKVANVFDDMINRSVPAYRTVVGLTGIIAKRFYTENSRCYDLGCSLGATTLAIAQQLPATACIIGVDNSPAMIKRCQQIIDKTKPRANIELLCQNIQDVAIQSASVVALNYTLQFIPVEQRPALLEKIYHGMQTQGALLLSEKILLDKEIDDVLFHELHHDYKRANGYSDLEISQKRSALENVLVRESLSTHQARLKQLGFSRVQTWFQCVNFASLLAIK